jgi:hypothetical protein
LAALSRYFGMVAFQGLGPNLGFAQVDDQGGAIQALHQRFLAFTNVEHIFQIPKPSGWRCGPMISGLPISLITGGHGSLGHVYCVYFRSTVGFAQ